jgi:hypothetical protein
MSLPPKSFLILLNLLLFIVICNKVGHNAILIHNNLITFRLVSGSGDIKITKDGNVLLNEMVSC